MPKRSEGQEERGGHRLGARLGEVLAFLRDNADLARQRELTNIDAFHLSMRMLESRIIEAELGVEWFAEHLDQREGGDEQHHSYVVSCIASLIEALYGLPQATVRRSGVRFAGRATGHVLITLEGERM